MLAADLNGYLFAEFRAYAKIAERAGQLEKSQEYFDLSSALAAKIEERLWDASLSLYVNVDSLTGQTGAVALMDRVGAGIARCVVAGACRARVAQQRACR